MTISADVRPQTTAEPHDARPPRWVRPGLLALLAGTAVLYLWGLGSSGWANNYYAAAAQAGTQDWTAWLFGSLDSGNAITVDKPPAALWVMALSGRLFGFSAFTMLLPQALMGVGAVALLYAAVRRTSGPAAGLIAGAALALTPVAALMFRYNNPDALLVLLLVAAAYCMVRATETASTRWIALAGCVVGFAFLTKMLQAFLVVPGFALAFLVAAPVGLWKRIGKLLIAAAALIVSAGRYVALVSLWPADSRPYIGGSTDNSLLQLALGYNGIDRVVGGQGGPGGGGPGGGPGGAGNLFFGGDPGIGRLFGLSMGTEASWLLPAALIGLAAGLWFTRRTARTGHVRAGLLLWGGWLLVTGAVFSFMDGTIHPYYTVALAPAIAALVGISVRELWRGKEFLTPRIALATMSATTGVWAFILLDRTPDWLPALRWIVLAGSVVVAAVLVVGVHRLGRATAVLACGALLFGSGCDRGLHHRNRRQRAQRADDDVRSEQGRRFRRPRARRCPIRQRRAIGACPGCRQPLGRSHCGVNDCEQPRTEDRHVGHGDRRVHRLRQLAHARPVSELCRRRPSAVLHPRRPGWPARRQIGQRGRHHDVGAAELHAHRCRRNHRLRPANTLTATIGCATQKGTIA